MRAHGTTFGMSTQSRVVQFSNYQFDDIIGDVFITLFFGGCICVISEQDRTDNLARAMQANHVNFAMITPTVTRLLNPADLPLLKTIILVGEAAQASDIDRWAGHVRLFNAYGPSESSIFTTYQELVTRSQAFHIGYAFASGMWVVDSSNYHRLLPIGAVGELLIDGAILTRGYLNDEQKTAASFISNAKWADQLCPGRRMYRTGDLIQQRLDGSFMYVGRIDSQVKIRGQGVEMAMIEFAVIWN